MPKSWDDIVKDLDGRIEEVSTLARATALGMLALIWGLLFSDSASVQYVSKALGSRFLIGVAASCVVILLFDFLQYAAGYLSTKQAFDRAVNGESYYDMSTVAYQARTWFFWLKQALVVGTVLTFVIAVLRLVAAR